METFARRLRGLKNDKGVFVKEIAEACEVTLLTVQNWLKGSMPRPKHMAKLATYFSVSVDYLINGDQASVRSEMINELNARFSHMTNQQLTVLVMTAREFTKKTRKKL